MDAFTAMTAELNAREKQSEYYREQLLSFKQQGVTAEIDIKYFYRVKTHESIDNKISRYSSREDQYLVNNWLNNIFGARIILTADDIATVMDLLHEWQESNELHVHEQGIQT